MKTVKAIGTVNEKGILTLEVPVELEPGAYDVSVTIDAEAPEMIEIGPLKLYPLDWSAWPPGSTFGRDELYDDDGR